MATVENHFHSHVDVEFLIRKIDHLTKYIHDIMASIQELTAKVDALQTALDEEQAVIKAAIDALNQTVTDLQAIVSEGGTTEERQALADKLDAITEDLKGTIPDAPEA